MTGIVAQNVGRTSGLIKSAGGGGGVWTLIKTLTASDSATLSFVDGASDVVLDATYPIYQFKFISIHGRSTEYPGVFLWNGSTDTGSNYNVTKTSTAFRAYHSEGDVETGADYFGVMDLAQGTGFQPVIYYTWYAADAADSGSLTLYNLASTTFVKHFTSRAMCNYNGGGAMQERVGGYANTTSAVDAIQFKMADGNFDGKIKLYGLSDSL